MFFEYLTFYPVPSGFLLVVSSISTKIFLSGIICLYALIKMKKIKKEWAQEVTLQQQAESRDCKASLV